MIVTLKPISGTPKANLERARLEITRALNFRGSVTGVKAVGTRIIVEFEVNPQWDLSHAEKESYLREWIKAKVKNFFKPVSVFAKDEN